MPHTAAEKVYYEYISSKPCINTSDVYSIAKELPKKEKDCPYLFAVYGCQKGGENPFYRTTTSEYGWYTPNPHTVPTRFFPKGQRFSNDLARSGMYRNFSLNMT